MLLFLKATKRVSIGGKINFRDLDANLYPAKIFEKFYPLAMHFCVPGILPELTTPSGQKIF